VVIGEFLSRKGLATILAPITVASIDVLPRESYRALWAFHQLEETHHRRQLDGKAHRVDLPGIILYDLYLSQTQKGDSFLPVDNLKGLVSDI
jgi:hypothetical protein